tara:strand:- start:4655 stop:5563 length:909 start_codon:yes stop_codon:yes gene_type:complete
MTYRNLPIYIGQKNESTIASTVGETGSALPATNVSIDYPTQMSPKRLLGRTVDSDDQFLLGGASEVSISFSLLLHTCISDTTEQNYAFLLDHSEGGATGKNYFPVKVGDNLFGKCFLDSYNVNVRPFEPVVVEAKMTSYDPPRNHSISGDYSLPDSNLDDLLDSNKLVHGHTVGVTNASQAVSENVLSSISFSKTYSRTPVYKLGDIRPSDFLLDGVDSEMRIESTGLERLIAYSGSKLSSALNVALTDYTGASINPLGADFDGEGLVRLNMGAGSRVTAENYSMQGGETLLTNATIREVIV